MSPFLIVTSQCVHFMLVFLPVSKPLDREMARIAAKRERAAAEVAELDRQLEVLKRAQQELIGALVEEHRNESLHNAHSSARIIDTMDAETTTTRGARLETKHPGAKKIREVDGSIAKFAAKHRTHATTVRSWYATGEAAREIPRRWADLLAKPPYSIPVSVWRNGIAE